MKSLRFSRDDLKWRHHGLFARKTASSFNRQLSSLLAKNKPRTTPTLSTVRENASTCSMSNAEIGSRHRWLKMTAIGIQKHTTRITTTVKHQGWNVFLKSVKTASEASQTSEDYVVENIAATNSSTGKWQLLTKLPLNKTPLLQFLSVACTLKDIHKAMKKRCNVWQENLSTSLLFHNVFRFRKK